MNKFLKLVITILAFFWFVGCVARVNEMMRSWEGHHVNELIAKWGPPTQVMPDGSGGKILVYSQTKTYTPPGSVQTNVYGYGNFATGYTTVNPPQTTSWQAHRMFWVDRNGYIYRWAWIG